MLVQEVAQAAPDYLQWMLTTDFPQDTIKDQECHAELWEIGHRWSGGRSGERVVPV